MWRFVASLLLYAVVASAVVVIGTSPTTPSAHADPVPSDADPWSAAGPAEEAARQVARLLPTAGPSGEEGIWTTVFADEFDGPSIDRAKWRVNRYGGTSDDGPFNPQHEGAY
ncbi:hypothetical protein [Geodermatophilus ruber]|uniref:hypothetical protein n=1 Tax=Geodermatophilus ruber TaxID=504800 RepID=UPI001160CCC9|nr:hypothetical protein [Geodermatophilus ruber]